MHLPPFLKRAIALLVCLHSPVLTFSAKPYDPGNPANPYQAFPNQGFEDRSMSGWEVGGRKDARAVIIETTPVFESLSRSRKFRRSGGWERHPVVPYLERGQNRYAMRISSNGYITAKTFSHLRIEAGHAYEVSLVGISQNGGPGLYHLEVSYMDENGGRQLLGTHRLEAGEEELFRQTVAFTAETGEPHVGKKFEISARYRGTNIIDQVSVASQPIHYEGIEAIARQLPLVDCLDDRNASPRFAIRGFGDFLYTKPNPNPGSILNTGAHFESLAQFTPEENQGYTFYDLDGLVLADGEAATITLTLGEPYAHAGFSIGGRLFLLGRDPSGIHPFRTPDFMSWTARVAREIKRETILVVRKGEHIEWFACGRKGQFRIVGLARHPQLSLFASGMVSMGQFRHGKLSLQAYGQLGKFQTAPPSPYGRRNYPGLPEFNEPDSSLLTNRLSTDLATPLSAEELDAMVAYVSGFPVHGFGPNANPLFSLPKWFEPARIFQITRSKEVLDHLIRIADAAIVTRNGFGADGVPQGVRVGGKFGRQVNLHGLVRFPDGGFTSESDDGGIWFDQMGRYRIDTVSETSDSANSRTIVPAMAAFWISRHPETWDMATPSDPCQLGASYRERAERYLQELALNFEDYRTIRMARFRTEPLWEDFGEYYGAERKFTARAEAWEKGRHLATSNTGKGKKDEAVAAYDANNPKPEHPYKRAAINRFVSAVSCAGFAARAAETFGDERSMRTIDACAEKLLTSWFHTYHFLTPGHDGEFRDDPSKWYRVFGYTAPNVRFGATDYDLDTPRGQGIRSEDRAHMNFTLNGIQLLHESNRYGHIMTPNAMQGLARTIDEMVLPEYNLWRPLPRARKHRDVSPQRGFSYQASSLLMFGDYHPGLRQKLIRCLEESGEGHPRVMNLLNLTAMRARKHGQVPDKVVD